MTSHKPFRVILFHPFLVVGMYIGLQTNCKVRICAMTMEFSSQGKVRLYLFVQQEAATCKLLCTRNFLRQNSQTQNCKRRHFLLPSWFLLFFFTFSLGLQAMKQWPRRQEPFLFLLVLERKNDSFSSSLLRNYKCFPQAKDKLCSYR